MLPISLLTAIGLAGSLTANAQDYNPAIVNGSPTSGFDAVGMLAACDKDLYCEEFCSGTLIDQTWVLTAAHCVEPMADFEGQGLSPYFILGNDWNGIADYDEVDSAFMHPNYDSKTGLQDDIGLVKLTNGLTGTVPMPLQREAIDDSWIGTEITYVGFGITGTQRQDSGVKRTAVVDIVSFDSYFAWTQDTQGQGICSGDSGGAALIPSGGGYQIAGVNSHTIGSCEEAISGVVRVDAYVDWIAQYAPVGSGSTSTLNQLDFGDVESSTEDPVGCTVLPAVPSFLLVAVMALAGINRRRNTQEASHV